jgi:hypothetical protein
VKPAAATESDHRSCGLQSPVRWCSIRYSGGAISKTIVEPCRIGKRHCIAF